MVIVIEKLEDVGSDEVVRSWVHKRRPVLLKGAASNWQAVEKWGFDYFEKHYGDEMVGIGREKIAREADGTQYVIDIEGLSIRDFVRQVGTGRQFSSCARQICHCASLPLTGNELSSARCVLLLASRQSL